MIAVTRKEPKLNVSKFAQTIVRWFRSHGRTFPWRETSNPFQILIAEVLLRQTQAGRVVGPYLDLIERYPDAQTLAQADVSDLRKWFQPLGLVRRADRLVQCAQRLVREYNGHVPSDLQALMALPGIGIYSARAILCLSDGVSVPMIDEGIGRVLRRVLGLHARGPAYSDRILLETMESILPKKTTKEFNLGLIDIVAAYCRPHNPLCSQCPLARHCTYTNPAAKKIETTSI